MYIGIIFMCLAGTITPNSETCFVFTSPLAYPKEEQCLSAVGDALMSPGMMLNLEAGMELNNATCVSVSRQEPEKNNSL
jgi:hypothetical protein